MEMFIIVMYIVMFFIAMFFTYLSFKYFFIMWKYKNSTPKEKKKFKKFD